METQILFDLGIIVGLPIIRSLGGWATVALKDRRVTKLEWRKLAGTMIKVGLMGLVGYFGLESAGVDNAAIISSVSSFFLDKLFGSLKEVKAVRN